MSATTVRLNVTLPALLFKDLEESVGSRGKSAFIAQAVRESLDRLARENQNEILAKGYAARREEALELTREFEAADLEGLRGDY